MILDGTVINGQIVFDPPQVLPEGVKVRVEIYRELQLLVPQDDWERRLRAIAKDCGVSLTDEQASSEGYYD